jgi:hypothetical protein
MIVCVYQAIGGAVYGYILAPCSRPGRLGAVDRRGFYLRHGAMNVVQLTFLHTVRIRRISQGGACACNGQPSMAISASMHSHHGAREPRPRSTVKGGSGVFEQFVLSIDDIE